ncbi:MAG: zinc-binding alcohol dehydrogenase [Desulfomonile tiedjei]|uniref:Zinc-binding alcohol dehydrogenase n=1 Tax=Desulfomonile tiedjei TaxID=2358 RepID=A0A9D6V8A0_9BACT|nr:zinc-binding alcohol dehydrogenase [Desulfomonile tiedjei]
MKNLSVEFRAPYAVAAVEEPFPDLPRNNVLVETLCSAISPGTEMLLYRGLWPADLPVDDSIPSLAGKFAYPLKYGYSCVGKVIETGASVDRNWLGQIVFSFNPHRSYFASPPEHLIPVPPELSAEEAAFLPNMETAVSFLMDGRPIIGERVLIIGQGIVGLLTAGLLAGFPLQLLVTLDKYPLRREKSSALGACALDPGDPELSARILELLGAEHSRSGADLVYELSGNPAALDTAISAAGFGGRVVIGSWYGGKRAAIDLGGRFHRGRIKLISSQVSALAPEFTGLWTKSRRLTLALRMLERLKPSSLITHRFHVSRVSEAYKLLDEQPENAIQVILTYED